MKPRTSRLRRAWNVWLVLPEWARLVALLIILVMVTWFSGSSVKGTP